MQDTHALTVKEERGRRQPTTSLIATAELYVVPFYGRASAARGQRL